ncbi:BET1 homolog [Portunus trituberculatus]|uniref:BET1 n=1 Tax=Portunus trituberculatus TaxID=210409 RepID=A0A5B7CH57_PORTR|nr:BET1 homolog [Portunus trituberculatus]MPC08789.1 BET1 [Portunus trituberculatus]
MRRAQNAPQGGPAQHPYGQNSDSQYLAEENEHLTTQLKDKVKTLKSVSIEIRNEVRGQNTMLGEMDDEFFRSGNLLERSMKRLGLISRGSQHCHLPILFAFCFVVFLLLWVALKFR